MEINEAMRFMDFAAEFASKHAGDDARAFRSDLRCLRELVEGTTRGRLFVLDKEQAEWLRSVLERERDEDDAAGRDAHESGQYWAAGESARKVEHANAILEMLPAATWFPL